MEWRDLKLAHVAGPLVFFPPNRVAAFAHAQRIGLPNETGIRGPSQEGYGKTRMPVEFVLGCALDWC